MDEIDDLRRVESELLQDINDKVQRFRQRAKLELDGGTSQDEYGDEDY